jgi:hypothetical protein
MNPGIWPVDQWGFHFCLAYRVQFKKVGSFVYYAVFICRLRDAYVPPTKLIPVYQICTALDKLLSRCKSIFKLDGSFLNIPA